VPLLICDAHDTLVFDEQSDAPRADVIALVRFLIEAGWDVRVWSRRGADSAYEAVTIARLGIPRMRCYAKPEYPYTEDRVRQTLGTMPDLQLDDRETEAVPGVLFVHTPPPDSEGRKSAIPSVKRIVRRDGEWCVLAEDSDRSFGCYATEAEARARLRQIERFADKGANPHHYGDDEE